MIRPRQVLEIGTYSGYSALCLAEGLEEGATLHTFEINDEQEDFTRPWLEGSPYAGKIKFYIGDALKLLPGMNITFDLAFVDGDKRKYIEYYEWYWRNYHPADTSLPITHCGTDMYWRNRIIQIFRLLE